MKRKLKEILTMVLVAAVVLQVMPQFERTANRVQATASDNSSVSDNSPEGNVFEISDYESLQMAVSMAVEMANDGAVEAILVSDIADITKGIPFYAGNLTINLNGYTISGSTSLFEIGAAEGAAADSVVLTIKDDSEGQNGKIECLGIDAAIVVNGGTLNFSGGKVSASTVCFEAKNGSIVNISGGDFVSTSSSGYAFEILNECEVTISGGTFYSNNVAVYVSGNQNVITITGGSFSAAENGTWSYACNIAGTENTVNISGGTFNLNAQVGSSLVLGSGIEDKYITISGGVFNGRIARMIPEGTEWNYSNIYGDGSGNGIIADGCVLSDNTFVDNGEPTIFTADNVQVVNGYLVEFCTGRSGLEEYTENETVAAENADYYSLAPLAIDAESGSIYYNTGSSMTPVIDKDRVTNGNNYTFHGWYDQERTEEYASVEEFITSQETFSSNKLLYAEWDAEVSTVDGLTDAMLNWGVKDITVTEDLSLNSPITENSWDCPIEKTLDFGNHTIRCGDDNTSDSAFTMNSMWNIQNGSILCTGLACIQVNETAVLDNLNCKAEDSEYVVKFDNVSADAPSKILSGTYETTKTGGKAIWTVSSTQTATEQDITSLFADSYASSQKIETDGANAYLNAAKVIVSRTPITYIESGADVELGTYEYGDEIAEKEQSISNQTYDGDIVITDISVDNPVFEVTGEEGTKTLPGGSEDTYSYVIGVADGTLPGSYEGKVSVRYTRMDGEEGTYQQLVTMNITPKQLTITDPVVNKTKTYDGTVAADVTPGTLEGVVADENVLVTAVAEYDSADAGTGKTISVKYTISGADKDNYLPPEDISFDDGVINKAEGTGSVTIADYHVGEKPTVAEVVSDTNGEEKVSFYYKKKAEGDESYTTVQPVEEGTYIVKAVFADTVNYNEVEATADFTISYIATPEQPYTLTGTKNAAGWYSTDVVIHPAEGYTLSAGADGAYADSYLAEQTCSPVIRLKSGTGAVTRAINVGDIRIDKEKPVISGAADGGFYYDDELRVVITDANLSKVLLNGQALDTESGSVEIALTPSEYTITAEDMAGNAVEYSFQIEEAWMREGIISDGIKNLRSNKEYKLGSGQWKVSGDNTVYNGGTNIYVPVGGEYDFQKQ